MGDAIGSGGVMTDIKMHDSSMLFECHVTCGAEACSLFDELASALHWSTSTIDGDPLLGKGPRFYFTTHAKGTLAEHSIRMRMRMLVRELRAHGVEPVRCKIEAIVYDTKGAPVPAYP